MTATTLGLMHGPHVEEMQVALIRSGVTRSDVAVDNAIQSAIEALFTDNGYRSNPDTARGWWEIHPHALRFMECEQDAETGRIYDLELA